MRTCNTCVTNGSSSYWPPRAFIHSSMRRGIRSATSAASRCTTPGIRSVTAGAVIRAERKVDLHWHAHVRMDRQQYLDLRAWLLERAVSTSASALGKAFSQLPVAAYAPVRRQLLLLLRSVNRVRCPRDSRRCRRKCSHSAGAWSGRLVAVVKRPAAVASLRN